jgi:hypothetical protein
MEDDENLDAEIIDDDFNSETVQSNTFQQQVK